MEAETEYMHEAQSAIKGDNLVGTLLPLEHVFGEDREIVVDLL